MNLIGILEGILFLAGDDGVSLESLIEIVELSKEDVLKLINQLEKKYESSEHGIKIEFLGNKYKMVTKKEYKDYYQKLLESDSSDFLSQAALETLAIIAYNQPVSRVQVDEIRGVGSSHMVRKLLYKNLVKEIGRSDLPGRPILYGTTSEFLDYFGLGSIEELPKFEVLPKTEDIETNLFQSKYKEVEEIDVENI